MKSFKLIFTILFCLFCLFLNAQTNYKGVYLDRDQSEKYLNAAIIKNTNKYPVIVKFQYKVGSRDTEWINYINEHDGWYDDYIEIEAYGEEKCYVESKIYGLNLIYVDILQPSVGEKILEGIGLFGKGMQDEMNRRSAAELNGN